MADEGEGDGEEQQLLQQHEAEKEEDATDSCSENLEAWLALPPSNRPRLIDVRTPDAFARRRLAGSANLPMAELSELLFELPEPTTPLALVAGSVGEGQAARVFLVEKGWRQVPFVFAAGEEEDGGLWGMAEAAGVRATGPVPPLARTIAYTPQPFLAHVIPMIEAGLAESFPLDDEEGNGRWSCCDVGCGSGRDAVWLAKRGVWCVKAVDRLPKCLERVRQLSERHGVEAHVVCEAAVIKTGAVVAARPFPPLSSEPAATDAATASSSSSSFEQQQYHLVVVVRFLEREFFDALKRMVRPGGGYLLFVSFLDRSAEGIQYESPKDPRRLLQPGELARAFEKLDGDGAVFEVVKNEVWPLPDGRFVSAFLGRRR